PRPPTPIVALVGVAVTGLSVLTGCSGTSQSGVAQAASTASRSADSSSRSGSTKGDPAAYSACMRRHGVPNFPDPDSQGRIKIVSGQTRSGGKFGLDVNSPQFRSAMRACRSLDPNGGRPDPQAQAKEIERALAFARCMRSHGVPKFPDPKISAD